MNEENLRDVHRKIFVENLNRLLVLLNKEKGDNK